MSWCLTKDGDPRFLALADRHYSREQPGTPLAVGPGTDPTGFDGGHSCLARQDPRMLVCAESVPWRYFGRIGRWGTDKGGLTDGDN